MPLPRGLPKRSLQQSFISSPVSSTHPLRPLRSPYVCLECRLFSTTGPSAAAELESDCPKKVPGKYVFMNGRRKFIPENGVREKFRARLAEIEKAAKEDTTRQKALPMQQLEQLGGSVGVNDRTGGDRAGEWTDDMVSLSGLTRMKLGELAEIRSASGIVELGVFIRLGHSTTEPGNAEFLTSHGVIISHFASRIMFSIPDFIPASDIQEFKKIFDQTAKRLKEENPIGPEITSWLPPADITRPLVKKLRDFQTNVEQLYFGKTSRFAELWEKLAYQQQTRSITTREAAEMVFGKNYGNAELYATHCALCEDGLRFIGDKGYHRYTSRWRVRSKQDLKMLSTVTKWVRASKDVSVKYRPKMPIELHGFIVKAQQLIDRSRKLRKEGRNKEVVEVPIPQIPWGHFDLMIIDYLMTRLKGYGLQRTPLDGLAPHILRATNRYEDATFDGSMVFTFLTEIGAYKPWENLILHSPFSNAPCFGAAPLADTMQAAYDKVKRLEQLELEDSMKDLRKDWGSMPVFAVDDADAHEIDDGVSIEKLPNGDLRVHAHIANPSAFLKTDHWVAKIAQERASTMYAQPFVAGMLPPIIGMGLGLGPGSPVLTISATLDKDTYESKDIEVQPGTVNNVKRITYHQFQRLAGAAPYQYYAIHSTTQGITNQRPEPPLPDLTPSDLETLKLMNDTAKHLIRLRARRGMLNLANVSFSTSIDSSKFPLTTTSSPSHIHPILYSGIPHITCRVQQPNTTSANSIIAEFMILANSSIATFCDRNNIPAPYRILELNPDRADLKAWFDNVVYPSRDEYGQSEHTQTQIHHAMQLATPRLNYKAGPQTFMGLPDGYVRTTSPLRRFTDMIAHWNLQHFIRARSGMGAVTTPFPMDVPQMEELIPKLDMRERMNNFVSTQSSVLLHGLAVKGALDLKEHGNIETLPWGDEPIKVHLVKADEFDGRGFANVLGAGVKVVDESGEILKRWTVMEKKMMGSSGGVWGRVVDFNTGDRMLLVKALGVVNDGGEWVTK